jgi:hypothetical protein
MIEEILRYISLVFVGLCIEIIIYSTAEMITKKKWLKWTITGVLNIIGIGIYFLITA